MNSFFIGGFFWIFFLCTIFNTASSAALRFHCRRMLGSNQGQLRLRLHMKTEKERQVADRGLEVGGVVESQMDYSKHRVPECPFFRRNRFLRPSLPVSVSPLGPKRGEQHSLAGEGVGWGDPIPTTRQKAWHSVYSVSQITVGSTFFTVILVLLSCKPHPPPPRPPSNVFIMNFLTLWH